MARRAAGEWHCLGEIKSLQVELCQHLPSPLLLSADAGRGRNSKRSSGGVTALLPSGAPWTAECQGRVKCAVGCVGGGVCFLQRKRIKRGKQCVSGGETFPEDQMFFHSSPGLHFNLSFWPLDSAAGSPLQHPPPSLLSSLRSHLFEEQVISCHLCCRFFCGSRLSLLLVPFSRRQTQTAAYIWTQMRLCKLFMAFYDILIFMPLPTEITIAFEFSARN